MAFNRLAAYPRILRDLKAAQTELAEAKKTIEGLRSSGPGPAKLGTDKKPTTGTGNILDEFYQAVPE